MKTSTNEVNRKMKTYQFFTIMLAIVILPSCDTSQGNDMVFKNGDNIITEQPNDDHHDLNDDLSDGEKKSNIEVMAIPEAPTIPGSSLQLVSPQNGAKLEPGELSFEYAVENFQLGSPTTVKTDYNLAESAKGQHIHAILNNEPYMAHYEPYFSKELGEGHYVLMSFLSRSYHMSCKGNDDAQVIQFTVGDPEGEPYDIDQPMLFYSRPKGTYNTADKPNVMLDFYLHNCVLSEDGFKIEAKIAGFDFTITEWQPYVIRGLPPGINTITLTLVDGNGDIVDSPFNPVTRQFDVKMDPKPFD
jgi:hypothetical protein